MRTEKIIIWLCDIKYKKYLFLIQFLFHYVKEQLLKYIYMQKKFSFNIIKNSFVVFLFVSQCAHFPSNLG